MIVIYAGNSGGFESIGKTKTFQTPIPGFISFFFLFFSFTFFLSFSFERINKN